MIKIAQKALRNTHNAELWIDVKSQSVSGNTSSVYWEVGIRRVTSNSGAFFNGNTSQMSGKFDGTSINTGFTYDFRKEYYKKVNSGTKTVSHNSDGSKTVSMNASFSFNGGLIPNGSISGSKALPTIPRASSFGSLSGSRELGTSHTINISRKSGGFTHDVWYKIYGSSGDSGWQKIGTKVGTSVTFTPNADYAKYETRSTALKMDFYLKTYSGSTAIGGNVHSNGWNMQVPRGAVPSFSSLSHSETVTSASQFGVYVQGLSRIKFTINGASGSYGSTISSYSISFNGSSSGGSSWTTGVINKSGNITASATVRDSRGRSASKSITISVSPYNPPQLTSLSVKRSNSSGGNDPRGTYANISFNSSITNINGKNTRNYEIRTRPKGGAWESKASGAISGTSSSMTKVIGTYSGDNSFDVQVIVKDKVNSTIAVGVLPAGEVMLHLLDNKMGVGKLWERGTIDAIGPLYQNNGTKVVDFNGFPDWRGVIDFNEYWKHGVYIMSKSEDVKNSKNAPDNVAGRLEIYTLGDYSSDAPNAPWKYSWQVFTNLYGTQYFRHRDSGGDGTGSWSSWKLMLNDHNVKNHVVDETNYYRKWSNGTFEWWGEFSGQGLTAAGNLHLKTPFKVKAYRSMSFTALNPANRMVTAAYNGRNDTDLVIMFYNVDTKKPAGSVSMMYEVRGTY